MHTIYILSGRVFGKNIYEIDCTTNINDRFFSNSTGYPECNVIHYSSDIYNSDFTLCRDRIRKHLRTYKMSNTNNFYILDLGDAKKILYKLIDQLPIIEIKSTSKSCF